MNRNQEKKKQVMDKAYWEKKLKDKKEYEEKEEAWKKELIKLNPEKPKTAL